MSKKENDTQNEPQKKLVDEKNAEQLDKFKALANARTEEERVELRKNLSIRERLLRRTYLKPIEVTLSDDLGPFKILCRPLTWNEQKDIAKFEKIIADAAKNGNVDKLTKDFEEYLFKFLAYPTGVCLNPELNIDYWRSGDFDASIAKTILFSLGTQAAIARENVASFREK